MRRELLHIKEEYYFKKKSFEVPELKKLAPDADMIIQEVCKYYDVFLKDLFITKKGWFNKPRNIVFDSIYAIRTVVENSRDL